jgi:type I restriction enzyme S subunit
MGVPIARNPSLPWSAFGITIDQFACHSAAKPGIQLKREPVPPTASGVDGIRSEEALNLMFRQLILQIFGDPAPPKEDSGIAFLTIGNITNGYLDFSNCRFVSRAYFDSLAIYRKPAFGDILYTVVGATFGRPVFVDSEHPFCVQRHIAILKPPTAGNTRFLQMMLASPFSYDQATRSTTGTAQPTIPLRPLRNFLAPVPPLAEQHRIVAKVDELMAICDQLEAWLATAQTEASRLLESVLFNALNAQAPSQSSQLFA